MKNSRNYFSPTSDVGFKKLFASEKNEDLRLQLLNAIITDESPVISAELMNPVHTIAAETTATFDLYCRREDGSRIIVEMQKTAPPTFLNRALAYTSLAFLDQWEKDWKYEVDRVYFIGIMDEVLFRDRPGKAFTKVMLMTTDEPHQVVNWKYLQIFVELPKLAKVASEDMNPGERFLNAMGQLYDWDSRPAAYQDKSLDRLFAESAYDCLTDEEQIKHDKEMTTEQDYQEYLEHRVAESWKEGRIEGKEEGKEEARIEMARKLKELGVDVIAIAKATGLSVEDISSY